MKRYYSEYIAHCLTFYTRYPDLHHFRSETDKANWQACHEIISSLSEDDKGIVIAVYQPADTVRSNVSNAAKNMRMSRETVWKIVNDVERRVAEKRGLV